MRFLSIKDSGRIVRSITQATAEKKFLARVADGEFEFRVTGMTGRHNKFHATMRIGWLRASVLGSNDGVISTASIIIGISATGANYQAILTAALASLVAGAMSMAAGDCVSVGSQAYLEKAQIKTERGEIENDHAGERKVLQNTYVKRGFSLRMLIWGAFAIPVTTGAGALFGTLG